MRKYCWILSFAILFFIIIAPVWAVVKKIPSMGTAEYKIFCKNVTCNLES